MKRQPTEREKIFANDMPNKGLKSKVYKQLTQINVKNTNLLKKWAEDLNTYFPKKTYTWLTGMWKDAQYP